MGDFFSFLWGHPSLTAILLWIILAIVVTMRSGRRDVNQKKDTLYGPAQGYTGRKLERDWKENKETSLLAIGFYALIFFLIYRFLKTVGLI